MLEQLLKPEIQELIQKRDLWGLRRALADWEPNEIADLIDALPASDDVIVFRLLPRELAADTFEHFSREKQEELIEALAVGEITLRDWWRVMRREVLSGRPFAHITPSC